MISHQKNGISTVPSHIFPLDKSVPCFLTRKAGIMGWDKKVTVPSRLSHVFPSEKRDIYNPVRYFSIRFIESMMGLRLRQGNFRQVFRLFSPMRGCSEHVTDNLKTSLRFPCRGINTIINYFSHTSSFSSFSQQENEVAIFSVCPRIQKCNMQNRAASQTD